MTKKGIKFGCGDLNGIYKLTSDWVKDQCGSKLTMTK